MKTLEICAVGLSGALNAQQAGADRIELCENLESGGLTPSYGTLKTIRSLVHIPMHVLIRPRRGDYVYDPAYIDIMLNDIKMVKSLGYEGIVTGALDRLGSLDIDAMQKLLKAARPMKVTFHRAVDVAYDPMQLIQQLIDMGIERVLTSGGMPTAIQGLKAITAMQKAFGDKIAIMAGSGINSSNVLEILSDTGVNEIHLSATTKVFSQMNPVTKVQKQSELIAEPHWWWYDVDGAEVEKIIKLMGQAYGV